MTYLERSLVVARSEEDGSLPYIGLVGDTYTIVLSGKQTAGRFTTIDMYVRPGGGPAPHRHDFEEMLAVLEGEIEATFRGQKSTLHARETFNVLANLSVRSHQRLPRAGASVCVCAPSGQEEFSKRSGGQSAPVRPPPPLDEQQHAAFVVHAGSQAGAAVQHQPFWNLEHAVHARATAWPMASSFAGVLWHGPVP